MPTAGHVVLIVDDDEEIREVFCELLSDEGYTAVGAANGQQALDFLHSNPLPCLVLLDLMMPVMDGWRFNELVKQDPKLAGLPIVVVTAAGEHRVDSIAPLEVLSKPVRLETVLGVIQQHC